MADDRAMNGTRICSVDDCDRPQNCRGWCKAHYDRWRAYGDPIPGKPLWEPAPHGCVIEGCEMPHRSRGWCEAHYTRWRIYGDPLGGAPPRRPIPFEMCSVEGCRKPREGRSEYCRGHGRRVAEFGSTLPSIPLRRKVKRLGPEPSRRRLCNVDGCSEERAGRGYCRSHYGRWQRYGDPEGQAKPRPVRSYGSAHTRVRRLKGSAKKRSCVDCGGSAEHWSYDHQDPDEIWEEREGGKYAIPYSLNLDHYQPRCRICHQRFDFALLEPRERDEGRWLPRRPDGAATTPTHALGDPRRENAPQKPSTTNRRSKP